MSVKNVNEELVKCAVEAHKFNEIHELNGDLHGLQPNEVKRVTEEMLKRHKESYKKGRSDLSLSLTVDRVKQMGAAVEQLDKRLQEHIRMLRKSEVTLGPGDVLELDSAKGRADLLVEVLRAKQVWCNNYEELQLLESTDHALKYTKLVALQQSFNTLKRFYAHSTRELEFERMKDEFLSWFSSATVAAIDAEDVKQLQSLKEKYASLNRNATFEQAFGSYAKNKIRGCVEECTSVDAVFKRMFEIWRRCIHLADTLSNDVGSELIANSLNDGITSKWEAVLKLVDADIASAECPIAAAKKMGERRQKFMAQVSVQGDDHLGKVATRLYENVFGAVSESYTKQATSQLLAIINKITPPTGTLRLRTDWLPPHIDELQKSMRVMVEDAKSTFGPETFLPTVLPSLEHSIKEFCSLVRNQDLFNLKRAAVTNERDGSDRVETTTMSMETTEAKITAICCAGYLLAAFDDVDTYLGTLVEDSKALHGGGQLPMASLVKLSRKIIQKKLEAIASTITQMMDSEMMSLKLSNTATSGAPPTEEEVLRLSLPAFSTPPHSYITTVGHALLSQMNAISSYATDRSFIRAVVAVAGDDVQEDQADQWMLSEVAKYIMEAFCRNVGATAHLSPQLARQFHADAGTQNYSKCAELKNWLIGRLYDNSPPDNSPPDNSPTDNSPKTSLKTDNSPTGNLQKTSLKTYGSPVSQFPTQRKGLQ